MNVEVEPQPRLQCQQLLGTHLGVEEEDVGAQPRGGKDGFRGGRMIPARDSDLLPSPHAVINVQGDGQRFGVPPELGVR